MSRLKAPMAYVWALMAVPIVLATFIGMNFWARKLVSFTKLKVSPWCTGGDITSVVDRGTYETHVHRPVFGGLFGPRARGFVQVTLKAGDGSLPASISEEIDFNGDDSSDFRIDLDTETNEASLESHNDRVIGLGEVLAPGKDRVIRVTLRRDAN
ncbi:MAG: hypothetical protein JSU70_17240 [Phycisphaerales bacterium]|nr:MAG: hypothetical protein JSU70_17240 [Phycisphaerales bacterium]